jgi:hypothetical protein
MILPLSPFVRQTVELADVIDMDAAQVQIDELQEHAPPGFYTGAALQQRELQRVQERRKVATAESQKRKLADCKRGLDSTVLLDARLEYLAEIVGRARRPRDDDGDSEDDIAPVPNVDREDNLAPAHAPGQDREDNLAPAPVLATDFAAAMRPHLSEVSRLLRQD